MESERVPGKNFRPIKGIPLYQYFLDKMSGCDFDKVYVDTDSEEIAEYAQDQGLGFIPRLPHLAESDANGNDLLNYHSTILDADYYFQLFITSPLLKATTINECIRVLQSGNCDSVLSTKSIYTWFWFKKQPVNYDPQVLPRSQDAEPIIMETTGLYGITKDALLERRSRIGKNPYFFEVTDPEAIDLDTNYDFRLLELYA